MEVLNENDVNTRLNKNFDSFVKLLSSVRTGRASASFLEVVNVEVYGQRTALSHIANINVIDNFTLSISPWDDSNTNAIFKAIQESDLGVNPSKQGRLIIVPLPKLTEERRKELGKLVKQYEEQAKVSIRNIRRDIIAELEQKKKDSEISEDDLHRSKDKVQKMIDLAIKKMDEVTEKKIKELLTV